jgi:hypothetical protein
MLPSFYTGNKFDDVVDGLKQYYFFIPHIILCCIIAVALLLSPSTVKSDEWYIIDQANLVASTPFGGFDNSTCYYMNMYTATSSLDIISLKVGVSKYNNPIDYVYAFFATRSGSYFTEIATSTNWFLGSSLSGGTSKSYRTFYFGTSTMNVASGTDMYFGVRRSGAIDSNNRYHINTQSLVPYPRYSAKCSSNLVEINGLTKASWQSLLVQDTPQPEATSTCPSGYECYTIEEMATATQAIASSTEAIYAVGYSVNLYLGIFMALIFGSIAMMFFRKFIS